MSYDYSKIKKWTAGAPDMLKPGMICEVVMPDKPLSVKQYKLVGDLWETMNYYSDIIIRWAWLPGFEPED